jgi:hypothetical protein
MKLFLITLLSIATLGCFHTATAAPSDVPKSCRVAINSQLSRWHLAEVSEEVSSWANQEKFNPVIATGDFDGNGKIDQAILIEHEKDRKIAVCLSTAKSTKLVVISNPYCRDYVSTSRAGGKHYNYDTDKTETIKNDGVSVSCFEKAGATYVYENGAFRQIVDSD